MIVTCEECSTRFQLDESRIPLTGARVRCSRCKHAFFLPNPNASAGEAADSIAEAVAADEAVGLPMPVSDLTNQDASPAESSPPEAQVEAEFEAEVEAEGEAEGEAGGEAEEEDWEFSEEIRIEGDDDLDAEEGPGAEDDFDAETDFDRGFDASDLSADCGGEDPDSDGAAKQLLGVEAEAAAEVEIEGAIETTVDEVDDSGLELEADYEGSDASAETGVEAGHDESSFGSVDDFSSLMEDDDLDSVDVSLEAGASSSPVSGDEAEVGLDAAKDPVDEVGEPESWDLARSADFSSSRPSGAGAIDSSASDSACAGMADGEADYDPAKVVEVSAFRTLLARFGNLTGWISTIVVVAFVTYLNLEPEWTRRAPTTQSLSIDSVVAQTTDSGWIETTRSGSLLIVNGLARNTGGRATWPPTLQIAILDERGGRIMTASAAVGEPLAESILREASPLELERAAALARQGFVRTQMGSGEVRAFQAVFGQLPEGAGRMLLEVVGAEGSDSTLLPSSKSPNQLNPEATEGSPAASVAGNPAPPIEG